MMGGAEAQMPGKSETRRRQRWNEGADHIIWDSKDPQALLISEFPNYMNSFPSLFKVALFELFSFVNEMKVLNSTDTYRKYSFFFFLNIKIMPPQVTFNNNKHYIYSIMKEGICNSLNTHSENTILFIFR